MNLRSQNKARCGFTLIELLIVIFMLVWIAMGIYQAVTSSFELRDEVSRKGDFYSEVRLAMQILDKDISMIYDTHNTLLQKTRDRDPNSPLAPQDATDLSNFLRGLETRVSDFWGAVLDRTGVRHTRLTGEPEKVSFISANNVRLYKDSRQSIFAKIVYALEEPDNKLTSTPDTKVLVKTKDPDAFDVEEEEGDTMETYPLLRNVKAFKFTYCCTGQGRDQWAPRWDSDQQETKGEMPRLIRLELTVQGKDNLTYEGDYLFKPETYLDGIPVTI